VYTAASATVVDLRPGPTSTTGNALDVVPQDGAYLAVQGPGGLVNFTRDGHLALDESRRLVVSGNPVLGKDGQGLSVPSEYVPEILPNGTVRGVRAGGGERGGKPDEIVLGELATFRLSGQVERTGPALLRPGPGGAATPLQDTRLRVGEVELGNASPLETTVLMISAQRNFDASMQALQTYRSMNSAELGRTR
jgi:flagellar basal-body rod protein FlgF